MKNHLVYTLIIFSVIFSFTSLISQSLSVSNDNIRVKEDTSQLIDVLKNDNVSNRQDLEIIIIQNPKRGTAILRGNNIYYTPNENQNGIDELIYKVDTGFSIDTATVVIKITMLTGYGKRAMPDQARNEEIILFCCISCLFPSW